MPSLFLFLVLYHLHGLSVVTSIQDWATRVTFTVHFPKDESQDITMTVVQTLVKGQISSVCEKAPQNVCKQIPEANFNVGPESKRHYTSMSREPMQSFLRDMLNGAYRTALRAALEGDLVNPDDVGKLEVVSNTDGKDAQNQYTFECYWTMHDKGQSRRMMSAEDEMDDLESNVFGWSMRHTFAFVFILAVTLSALIGSFYYMDPNGDFN